MTHFARALGAARTGALEQARAEERILGELHDQLVNANDSYWAEQVDIQWQVVSAWLLSAEGRREAALNAMRAAADRGVTLVVASHDTHVLDRADQIVQLDHGRRVR